MSKNKDNEVSVQFIGNSAIDVTGSAVLITFMNKTYLIECGSVQGYSPDKCYTINSQLISSIDVNKLEVIWLCHNHNDHIGMIPGVVRKEGFHADIFCTHETVSLSKIMLLDASHIIGKEAEILSKTKKVSPLYKDEDVLKACDFMRGCDIGVTYKINDNVSFKLHNNNHCLGASQLEVFFKKSNNTIKKLVYTSDLGSTLNKHKPFVTKLEKVTQGNVTVLEGTYGKKDRSFTSKDVYDEKEDLKNKIKLIIAGGGKVLLPTFSFSRTQEVLVDMYNMFHDDPDFGDTPVIIDSKLSVNITNCYKDILKDKNLKLIETVTAWKNVELNKDFEGTKMIIASSEPCIILSSQGFCDAGRSQLYAKNFLTNPKDAILFVGYCPANSVGGRVQSNKQGGTVKICGLDYVKSCFVKSYRTYSSHAQNKELVDYITSVNSEQVIIHHSDKAAKEELIKDAKEALSKVCKTTKVIGSTRNMEFFL